MIALKNLKFFTYSALALVSVVILRIIQIVFLTNPQNGFFYDGYQGIGTAISVFIVSITAVAALFGFFAKTDELTPAPKPSYLLGGSALLAGISQLIEPFSASYSFADIPNYIAMLRNAFIIAGGIVFIYFGMSYIMGQKPKYKFLVIPIMSWILRLVYTFLCFSGMSNISDNLYDILTLASIVLFLLCHGKLLCFVKIKNGLSMSFVYGIISVLMTSVAILPRWIVSVFGAKEFAHTQIDSPLSVFFMSVYIAIYLVGICRAKKLE